jgi:gelsolin
MKKIFNTLRKIVDYKIEDTNMALFGTDIEKNVKHEASLHEEQWHTAGKKDGIDVWRIEKFKIVPVPHEKYGSFYNGDSYIVLRTRAGPNNTFTYDVHFWLGEYTSQDEAGTAAYKTVELDDFFNGAAVQHREISKHESELFRSYFTPPGVKRLEGGIESGFNIIKPEEYTPRLLHIKSEGKNIDVNEVPLERDSLNSGDIFILDTGLKVIQWVGSKSSALERGKAAALARSIADDERNGKAKIEVNNEGDSDLEEFWSFLKDGEGPIKSADEANVKNRGLLEDIAVRRLFKISDASGKVGFTQVADGNVTAAMFNSSDAFLFDAGPEIFVWLGKGANVKEKRAAMQFALDYMSDYKRPKWLPITKVNEGTPNDPSRQYLN